MYFRMFEKYIFKKMITVNSDFKQTNRNKFNRYVKIVIESDFYFTRAQFQQFYHDSRNTTL